MKEEPRSLSGRLPNAWWSASPEELLQALGVDPERGLTADQVTRLREAYGSNRLEEAGPTSLWRLLWESVKSPMMVVLLTIAGISLALGQLRERCSPARGSSSPSGCDQDGLSGSTDCLAPASGKIAPLPGRGASDLAHVTGIIEERGSSVR